MLAKETSKPFDDEQWIFEIKWDGYRAIAEKDEDKLSLYSRNGLNFLTNYPSIGRELSSWKKNVVLDGEIVVLNEDGQPQFQLLQHYSENQHRPLQYQVFDLLSIDGKDITGLPLTERKQMLQEIVPGDGLIRYSDHIVGRGMDFFKATDAQELEGMMAKKGNSLYHPGKRSADWLKVKHHKTEEAIIVGYTAPAGSRRYFGALILAATDKGKYRYIGHTGTGFSDSMLKELYEQMKPLEQRKPVFDEKIKTNSPVTWIRPELVCEVKFTEITRDGMLRHPVFLHLRTDKDKNEVTMAQTKTVEKPATNKAKKTAGKAASKDPKKQATNANKAKESTEKEGSRIYTFGKHKVTVTNPDKIYFPEDGITKGDVADYYVSMAEYILPYLKGRPESLLRNPNGIHASGFFHKDAAEKVPSYIKSEIVYSESSKKDIDYIVCDNLATLIYMNNLGCIEINPWHSTVKDLDKPDYLIIDIDPSDNNTFDQVIEAALVIKEMLDRAGAVSFCKTSGATGLHIYVPTGKKYSFEQVKDFAYLICMMANDELKEFTTLKRNLKKRGNNHIYLDYLQNRRGQTIACAYSLRPKIGATVSTPLLWEEVKKGLSPKDFSIHNIAARVAEKGDLFSGVLGKGIDLAKCLKKLGN